MAGENYIAHLQSFQAPILFLNGSEDFREAVCWLIGWLEASVQRFYCPESACVQFDLFVTCHTLCTTLTGGIVVGGCQ
jgi:hypothetical protein